MPISLREPGNTEMRTQAMLSLVSLATNVADPVKRLQAIRDSSGATKAVARRAKSVIPTDIPLNRSLRPRSLDSWGGKPSWLTMRENWPHLTWLRSAGCPASAKPGWHQHWPDSPLLQIRSSGIPSARVKESMR
jgi:hypothetical protein